MWIQWIQWLGFVGKSAHSKNHGTFTTKMCWDFHFFSRKELARYWGNHFIISRQKGAASGRSFIELSSGRIQGSFFHPGRSSPIQGNSIWKTWRVNRKRAPIEEGPARSLMDKSHFSLNLLAMWDEFPFIFTRTPGENANLKGSKPMVSGEHSDSDGSWR